MWNSRGKCYRPTYTGPTKEASLKSMMFKLRPDIWEGAEGTAFNKENGVCKCPEVLPKVGWTWGMVVQNDVGEVGKACHSGPYRPWKDGFSIDVWRAEMCPWLRDL